MKKVSERATKESWPHSALNRVTAALLRRGLEHLAQVCMRIGVDLAKPTGTGKLRYSVLVTYCGNSVNMEPPLLAKLTHEDSLCRPG